MWSNDLPPLAKRFKARWILTRSISSFQTSSPSEARFRDLKLPISIDLKLGTAPVTEQLDVKPRRIAEAVLFAHLDDPLRFIL